MTTETKATAQTRELLETEEDLRVRLLGYTVIPSLKGIEVEHSQALQILTPLGLSHFLPGLPETATALRRAVRAWIKEIARVDLGIDADEKILLRDITRSSKSQILALALVTENSDLNNWGLSYLINLRVFYNRSTDILTLSRASSTGKPDQDLLSELQPKWDYYRKVYVAGDLGRMIQRIIEGMGSFALRKEGGAYNVPYSRRTELQTLKDLIEVQFPGAPGSPNTSSLTAIPVIDSPKTKQQISQLAHKSFMADLQNLQKDLQRFIDQDQKARAEGTITKKGTLKHRVRPETMVARLADYQAMKNKITLYHETLGIRQEELLLSLESLSTTARSLMDAATDAMAEEMNLEEEEQEEKNDTTPADTAPPTDDGETQK